MLRRAMATVVAGAVLAACGGSGDDSSDPPDATVATTPEPDTTTPDDADATTTEPVRATTTTTEAPITTTTTVPAAVADAISIEPAVDVRVGTATTFSPVTEPEPVAAGDTVRTDQTGFAEIAYFDGSRTRLDVDTEFEVLELVDTLDESLVRTRMGVGRTWHRVQDLGETGEFSVETSVATAVVQGTAFSVDCRSEDECTFTVVEGALRIDLPDGTSIELVAPAALRVDAQGAGDPIPVPFDGAFGDEWLLDNAVRDTDAGFASAAEVYQTHGPSYGSITGTFTGTRTITSLECVTVCDGPGLGDVAERSYTFQVDCTEGVPCIGTIDTEYMSAGGNARATLPVVFDGTSYRWEHDFENPRCLYDDDGDGSYESSSGVLTTHLEWVMTPTAAEIIDGRWMVTAMVDDEQGIAINTVIDPGDCPDGFYAGDTTRYVIEVTRQS